MLILSGSQSRIVTNDVDIEDRKSAKLLTLAPFYDFKSISVDTLTALGECATDCLQNLGRCISSGAFL